MFESAELDHEIDKATFDAEEPALRAALLDAQDELAAAKKFSVLILIDGVDGAGKGETVNQRNAWRDPRYRSVLPPKGKTGIFFGFHLSNRITRRGGAAGPSSRSRRARARRPG